MSLNKAMLIGRLTRDPEMRYIQSGTAMTRFSIATNSYGKGADGERKEFTDFHNVVAWNQGKRLLAEICAQYLKKGSMVYVEGRLQTRSWEGQDGQKRNTTEINITEVDFLDTRSGGQGSGDGGGEASGGFDDDFSATPPPGAGAGVPSAGGPAAVGAQGAAARPAAAPAEHDIDPDDIPF